MELSRKNSNELFESYSVPKAVTTLALPTVAACLVLLLYNVVDTFFVGQLNDDIQTSAVTLASPVILAFNAVTNLFGTGCSSLISRALGVKEYEKIKRCSSFGFYCSVICGAVFSLASLFFMPSLLKLLGSTQVTDPATGKYLFWTVVCGAIPSISNIVLANILKSEGSVILTGMGVVGGCILNIVLDPVFIMPWGLGMGAAGAGCATFIANTAVCLYFVILIIARNDKSYISINFNDFRKSKEVVKDVFNVGIPAAIQNILNVVGMTIMNKLMVVYGTSAVAAIGITHKISMVPFYISMGVAQGIMPLIGYNYEAKNKKRVRDTVVFTFEISGAFTLIITALYYFKSSNLIRLFMNDPTVVEYGSFFLKGATLALPFLFVDFLAVSVFQACGLGKESLIFALLRKIAFEIPATIVLDKLFPMYGMAYAQFISEFILAVAAVLILYRIMKD